MNILAVFYTDKRSVTHKYCDFCKEAIPVTAIDTSDVYVVWEDTYDTGMPADEKDAERIFGKVCDVCHTPLGAWQVCKLDGGIDWINDNNPHNCEITSILNNPEDSRYTLACDIMDGIDTGWIEEFTEDQL